MLTSSRVVRRGLAVLAALAMWLVVVPAVAAEGPMSVSGRLVDGSGTPVSGMRVETMGGEASAQTTGVDGKFVLTASDTSRGLRIASQDVPRGKPFVFYTVRLTPTADQDLGDLVLPRLPEARVRVVDASGRPVPGIGIGSAWPVDLLDSDVGWDGAATPLGSGLPLFSASYALQTSTDDGGEQVISVPRRVDGSLVALPVGYRQKVPVEVSGSTADAVEQPDGTFLLTLDFVRPVVGVPTSVKARALDGRVTVSWDAPAPTDPPVTLSYSVMDLRTGGVVDAIQGTVLSLPLAHGVPTSYAVRARTPYGPGPWSSPSATVTSRPTTLTAVRGPRPGAFVVGRPTWRIVANQPVHGVSCRAENAPWVRVTCADLARVQTDEVWAGTYTIVVSATSVNGMPVEWRRTVRGPDVVDPHSPQRGWRRYDGGLISRRQGAWVDLRRTGPGDLHLIARTGPGQGIIEIRHRDRRIRRIDLSRRTAARLGEVTVRLPAGGPRKFRIRVLSPHRRVWIKGHAFVR